MKNKDLVYCPFCNSYEECEVSSVAYEATVRGVRFACVKHVALCKHCHEEVFVQHLADEDLATAYEQYKRETGLLTAEEIRSFRKAKGLSAAKLSAILGLGEKTITRFENGDIQSRSVDTALRLLIFCYDALGIDGKGPFEIAKAIGRAPVMAVSK